MTEEKHFENVETDLKQYGYHNKFEFWTNAALPSFENCMRMDACLGLAAQAATDDLPFVR